MKFASTFLITLTLCLLLSLCASAQTFRIDTGGNISTSKDLGYENPDAGVYVNSQIHVSRFAVAGDFNYLPRAHKIAPGDGHAFAYSATGRVYLDSWNPFNENPAKSDTAKFYLAAGGRWVRQYTSTFNRNVFRPAAGVGYDFDPTTRVEAVYEFRDRGELHRASVIGLDAEKLIPVEISRILEYLAIRPQIAFVRFDQDGVIRYGVRAGAQIGIGFAR